MRFYPSKEDGRDDVGAQNQAQLSSEITYRRQAKAGHSCRRRTYAEAVDIAIKKKQVLASLRTAVEIEGEPSRPMGDHRPTPRLTHE